MGIITCHASLFQAVFFLTATHLVVHDALLVIDMPFLEVENIRKTYNNAPLLNGVTFEVTQGDIACLLGPSGSGKTTLLRIIAGLESTEGGTVRLENTDLSSIPVHHRGVVLMFQDFALFPHRSVQENVAFGLQMQKKLSQSSINTRVTEMLALVGLETFASRNVIELSGGEQQRVALARSLAPKPKLLLLDEPLGALDRNLRERLLRELPGILRTVDVTTITVTHDQEEAFALADRVIILHDGKVSQQGSPEAVYRAPANTWVADFLGLDNLVPAVVSDAHTVQTAFGSVVLQNSLPTSGTAGYLLVYPSAIQISTSAPDDVVPFRSVVRQLSFHGHTYTLVLDIKGVAVQTILTGKCPCSLGDELSVWLDPTYLRWLPGEERV
jgi:ABC-type Fe3+/spermidine/putrescine transport system ATPase subunit